MIALRSRSGAVRKGRYSAYGFSQLPPCWRQWEGQEPRDEEAPGGAVCQLTRVLLDIKLADAGVGIYDTRVLGLLKGLSRERWLCPVYSKGRGYLWISDLDKLLKPGEKVCA